MAHRYTFRSLQVTGRQRGRRHSNERHRPAQYLSIRSKRGPCEAVPARHRVEHSRARNPSTRRPDARGCWCSCSLAMHITPTCKTEIPCVPLPCGTPVQARDRCARCGCAWRAARLLLPARPPAALGEVLCEPPFCMLWPHFQQVAQPHCFTLGRRT